MICSGIIWNAAYEYRNDILSDISSKYKILNFQAYNIGNEYQTFVREIYKFDNIPEIRLAAKIDAMNKFSDTNILFLEIDIPHLTKEFMPRKQKYTFIQIEQLKEFIRKKYSMLIKPYFFDIIFHMSDTDEESQHLNKILEKYNQYKIEPVNTKEK